MIKSIAFAALFIAAVVAVYLLIGRQKSAENAENVTLYQQHLQEFKQIDSIRTEYYKQDTARMGSHYRGLLSAKSLAEGQDKQQTIKAQHSAATFANSGKVEDCREALADCQQETKTKAGVIGIQNRMLNAADSTRKRDRQELARVNAVKDSAFAGWQVSNEALKKAQKRKPWGVGVMAGYGAGKDGLSPFVGVGLSYNLKAF